MDYAPRGKDKPKFVKSGDKPVIKRKKIRTARIVLTALVTGACEGCIPYVLKAGVDNHWLYLIPVFPVAIYLISKICEDLERWYKDDEL